MGSVVKEHGAYQLRHTAQSYTPARSRQCLSNGGLGALLESVGKTTLSASLSVLVPSHEDTGTTGWGGALSAETLDLAVGSDLVVLEDGHLDLLPLVLDLLGGGLWV